MGTVIDDAHRVLEWKDQLCAAFGSFSKSRAYLPGKPIFATSATLSPSMIESLADTLCYSRNNSFILNVGNDRPNITMVVCRMVGGESDFEALDFLLDEAIEGKPLIRTVVFFNSEDLTCRALQYIKHKLPSDSPYQGQISGIWATRSHHAKQIITDRFYSGKITILFATEVAEIVRCMSIRNAALIPYLGLYREWAWATFGVLYII
jgi:superfamily II DNA helicase RecQ